jgi:hypothetical protein
LVCAALVANCDTDPTAERRELQELRHLCADKVCPPPSFAVRIKAGKGGLPRHLCVCAAGDL